MIPRRRVIVILAGTGFLLYGALYLYFYSIQDDRFRSIKLPPDYKYTFDGSFQELNFSSKDGGLINSLLFKADSSRGVICFWKGNGGNLANWGLIAQQFLRLNYDVIITDYREHGKSRGEIAIESFYSDAQNVYDFLKTRYSENHITVIGYSLGTSIASRLSVQNNPLRTILIEPREKFEDKYLEAFFFPFPSLNRFPFRTDLDVQEIETPVAIISGTRSSIRMDALRLKQLLREKDWYFEIEGADHGSILADEELPQILGKLLR
jgi:alpha/beta superfamily hydrolase